MTLKSTYLPLILGAGLLLSGCTHDTATDPVSPTPAGVTLPVKVSTRAHAADGSEITYPTDSIVGEQHTSTVYVYVFEGRGDNATFTGYRANAGWSEYFAANPDPTTHGLPVHTAEMRYKIDYPFAEGGQYTLMGVATNETAQAAFDFPTAFPQGATLRSICADLAAQSRTAQIRQSEIYVGTRELMFDRQHPLLPEVEMSRRVAGVMACFKNIPEQLGYGTETLAVTHIRLSLYTPQNTSLPLLRRKQQPFFEDFAASPSKETDGEVVFSLAVPRPLTPETVVSGGGYLLPAEAPQRGIYTLHVDLMNDRRVLKSIRVKLPQGDDLDQGQTGGGTGIIDSESAFRFPIVANHFYALGTLASPIDLKGNGSDIVITIDRDWSENNDLEVDERPLQL